MLSFQLKFELSFKLARGRTEGLGRPLEFRAYVNSTSEEKNLDDNDWEATVRVIKRAELEMTDIGPLVLHKYTITNKGPWSVTNVTVQVDWPHQVASVFTKGKWALYLLETPTIQTTNTDNSNVVKKCSMALPTEWVNPLQLKLYLDSGSPYSLGNDDDFSEPSDEINRRIRSCAEKSAKCFTVTSLLQDYYDVTYVEISSSGRLLLDPDQGIEERDITNNFASASTHAYPDRPAIQETAPIPWWVIAAAVGLGLLILIILILIFWKCGFFKRNRPNQLKGKCKWLVHQVQQISST
uniref:Integrin alpha-2 domain-containing protein n=1 Tax=Parascaris equorum TaxID=6256 RepID=A0A914RTQ4_PAREQ